MRPGLTLVRAIHCSSVGSGDGSGGTGDGDVIRTVRGDITIQEVDAIVNAASEGLWANEREDLDVWMVGFDAGTVAAYDWGWREMCAQLRDTGNRDRQA